MESELKNNKLFLNLDSRVKTEVVLISVFIASMLRSFYILTAILTVSLILLFSIGMPINKIMKRLSILLSIAWLVFIGIIFTNGETVMYTISLGSIKLHIYVEGMRLGILVLIRILTSVTLVALLGFSTDMVDILETLRVCKIPAIIIDIAAMMYRYLYIIGEVNSNMNRARASRMGNKRSWINKVSDTGKIAAYVLNKSLDRSIQIYKAMLSRGYNENTKSPNYFQSAVPKTDKCVGIIIVIILLFLVGIDIIFC